MMKKVLLGSVALIIGFLSGFIVALGKKTAKTKYESVEIQPMKVIISTAGNSLGIAQGGGSCGK